MHLNMNRETVVLRRLASDTQTIEFITSVDEVN